MTQQEQEVFPETIITIGEMRKSGIPNVTVENARFFGRPDMTEEPDRFKNTQRKFLIFIPDNAVEPLRSIGYNVKTTVPKPEDLEMGREPVNHIKIVSTFSIPDDKKGLPNEMEFEKGPDVYVKSGDDVEKLNSKTVGILNRSRFSSMDLEFRGWEYDPEDSAGLYSARLVSFIGILIPNFIEQKWGRLS